MKVNYGTFHTQENIVSHNEVKLQNKKISKDHSHQVNEFKTPQIHASQIRLYGFAMICGATL